MTAPAQREPVVRLSGVGLHYGKVQALAGIDQALPAGCMVGLIGPDGVGKSSLLSLIAGARKIQDGTVWVLGGVIAPTGALTGDDRTTGYVISYSLPKLSSVCGSGLSVRMPRNTTP